MMTPPTAQGLRIARGLMDDFAVRTGVAGDRPPKRYLWTDAFAVCNYLGLHQVTGESRYRELALGLVDQVHHVLGRHRKDDPRTGWISGLGEEEGERHPTKGGLRIGKGLPERGPDEPYEARREWDRDGQYFHYLTKWVHALHRVSRDTGDEAFHRWAVELAETAHEGFTYRPNPGGPPRMYWKMSIDLSRPLVPSMGHHDPLDGLITYLDLQTADAAELDGAIAEATKMCRSRSWETEDPLGIGGLLSDVGRLGRLVVEQGVDRRDLLDELIEAAQVSLRAYVRSQTFELPVTHRLAFRELGLAIGLHAVEALRDSLEEPESLAIELDRILTHRSEAAHIERLWSEPTHRQTESWTDHEDINAMMLATSLVPVGYF